MWWLSLSSLKEEEREEIKKNTDEKWIKKPRHDKRFDCLGEAAADCKRRKPPTFCVFVRWKCKKKEKDRKKNVTSPKRFVAASTGSP